MTFSVIGYLGCGERDGSCAARAEWRGGGPRARMQTVLFDRPELWISADYEERARLDPAHTFVGDVVITGRTLEYVFEELCTLPWVQDCIKPEKLEAVLQARASRADADRRASEIASGHAMSTERVWDIYREIEKLVPLRSLQAFLLVVQDEGLSLNEYAQRAGASKSMMSRTLLEISDRPGGEGLITSRRPPMNLRRKEILLTPKGRDTVQRIDEVLALNRTFLKQLFADDAANCPPWLKLALSHPQRGAIPVAP